MFSQHYNVHDTYRIFQNLKISLKIHPQLIHRPKLDIQTTVKLVLIKDYESAFDAV